MPDINTPQILLRLKDVKKQTGLSTSRLYAKMSEGTFPKNIRLGIMSVAWIESEVQKWISERIFETRESERIA